MNENRHDLPKLKKKDPNMALKAALLGVGVIVVAGISFLGGMQYQKGNQPKVATAAATAFTGRRGGRNATFGTVSAVSTDSITVQDSRTGTAKTLGITSSTVVLNSGMAASVTDIKVGDNVIVAADTTDATKAARIMINPANGGGFGGPGATQQSDSLPSSDAQPL